jgi:FkbM family methyltransferase
MLKKIKYLYKIYKKEPVEFLRHTRVLFYGLKLRNKFDKIPLHYLDVGARGGVPLSWRILKRLGVVYIILVEADDDEAKRLLKHDPTAKIISNALGSEDGKIAELKITKGIHMTSLLEPHICSGRTGESLQVIKRTPIKLSRFDSIWDDKLKGPEYIKIDVQGYEIEVLKGFGKLIHDAVGIELEVRTEKHYIDQPTVEEVFDYMSSKGFYPVGFKPNGFKDKQRMVIFNAFFLNTSFIDSNKAVLWKKIHNISSPKRFTKWGF